jgi:hypothetical protein
MWRVPREAGTLVTRVVTAASQLDAEVRRWGRGAAARA